MCSLRVLKLRVQVRGLMQRDKLRKKVSSFFNLVFTMNSIKLKRKKNKNKNSFCTWNCSNSMGELFRKNFNTASTCSKLEFVEELENYRRRYLIFYLR